MLVIRRREGEALLLSGGVTVRVLDIGPGRVTLGITAPPEIGVLREEVQATQEANRAAAEPAATARLLALSRALKGPGNP
jgi:carbon storage regulator